ncbi:Phosphoglucosamine mutase [BD1-7 clade bacterium]|uniref:Phosphoglucosamine mutase n=1 Tax=BD1-7 clade bacterium TaxID=2029982 RepID=A0A5S9N636_9GAMM|nr:Phosphoglucosamine mutase [BD1-7 clade bacterium]CAA0084323.1 Phosphoglucosamine mutase [BD1-7 clade bacterium]
MRKYFGTDGIRGQVGQTPITPDFVIKLGWAVGHYLVEANPGEDCTVVIGKDTRISGYMFESAFQAGLVAAGVNVKLLGPMPTPAIAYLTRTFHAQIGIVISASHNPFYDNGIKFFCENGEKLSDEVEATIERYVDMPLVTVSSDKLGKVIRIDDAAGRYIEYCKSTVPIDFELKGLKVVLDCAHGATYHVAGNVFRELGAAVIEIGCEPNGVNINDGVGSTAPEALQQKVVEEGAGLGIAFDGDGDRVCFVDANGEIIDGDELLYIIASQSAIGEPGYQGVVGTLMTNMGVELAFRGLGLDFARAKVGDRYVKQVMVENGWLLGGESSGHLLCRAVASTGDGIVSALQVLAALATSGQSLQALLAPVRKFPQRMINVPVQDKATIAEEASVRSAVMDAEKQLNGSGRVLIRPSGTEALVRVMVEGEDDVLVAELTESLAGVVEAAGA